MTNNITKKIISVLLISFVLIIVVNNGVNSYNATDYKDSESWENATIIEGTGNEKFNSIKENYREDVTNVGITIMSDGSDVLRSNHGYCTDGNHNSVRGRNYWRLKIFSKQ